MTWDPEREMPVGDRPGYANEVFPFAIFGEHGEARAQKNHSQTLKRLSERCGLGWDEALAIIENREWRRDLDAERQVRAYAARLTQ